MKQTSPVLVVTGFPFHALTTLPPSCYPAAAQAQVFLFCCHSAPRRGHQSLRSTKQVMFIDLRSPARTLSSTYAYTHYLISFRILSRISTSLVSRCSLIFGKHTKLLYHAMRTSLTRYRSATSYEDSQTKEKIGGK
ncbi:hypothetical protein R3P38DRAFT_1118332 [Favolaschia claudopus]|uniref:Secreted protein n=1 Tax=Favolaschia claudopus TaxID=2862362 RepID=A0AAW0B9U9_9AGAR